MALCPGLPGSAGTRKVKPTCILLKEETVSGSGIIWAICNHASTPPLTFLQAGCPSCHPTELKHWRLILYEWNIRPFITPVKNIKTNTPKKQWSVVLVVSDLVYALKFVYTGCTCRCTACSVNGPLLTRQSCDQTCDNYWWVTLRVNGINNGLGIAGCFTTITLTFCN